MKPDTDVLCLPERQRILNLVLDARTLAEIDMATQQLRTWLRLHPEDTGMREGFEGLSLMRDIAEEQAAELTRTVSGAAGEKSHDYGFSAPIGHLPVMESKVLLLFPLTTPLTRPVVEPQEVVGPPSVGGGQYPCAPKPTFVL